MHRRFTFGLSVVGFAIAWISLASPTADARASGGQFLIEPASQPALSPAPAAPAAVAAPVPDAQQPTPRPEAVPAPAPQSPPVTPRPPRAAQPAVAPEPPAPAEAARPRPRGQPINVRLDILATDQSGTRPPVTKAMTVTVADGESARVRNSV
jgi:hypothetical protein